MAEISKLSGVAIADVAAVDAVLKANIANILGLTLPSGAAFLLDTYTGAQAGYSTRRIASSATNLMRIREDSGDTETDIGYDSNGDLDTAAIATHCGSANGYVVTWYDQSGNGNNATQSTESQQPQIYNGTAVITENGSPAIENVLSGAQGLEVPEFTINFSDFTCTLVSKFYSDSSTSAKPIFINDDGNRFVDYRHRNFSIARNTFSLGTETAQSFQNTITFTSSNAQQLHTITGTAAFVDGTSQGTFGFTASDTDYTPSSNSVVSNDFGHDRGCHARTSEIVVWTTDQDDAGNRSGIETNIDNYFQIPGM